MEKEYAKDRELFTRDGRVVICYDKTTLGFLVRGQFEDGGEGEPVLEGELFDEPPQAKYARRITDAQAILEKSQEELSLAKQELAAVKRETNRQQETLQKAQEKLEKTAEFKTYLNFCEGRITHVVRAPRWRDDVYEVNALEEMLEGGVDDGGDLKLLTLFGRSEGRADWRINQYCDGSGYNQTIYPAESEAQAQDIIREMLRQDIASDKGKICNMESRFKMADELGVEVPAQKRNELNKWRIKETKEYLEKLKKERLEIDQREASSLAELKALGVGNDS